MTHDTEHMAPAAPPPPPARPRPPLRRSESDRVVAGVAGGVARWLDIDPVIVRVLFVVLAVFGGSGLLLYAIGWLFVPAEGSSTSEAEGFIERSRGRSTFARVVLGVLLVIVALVLAANLNGPFGHWGGGGAILLLAATGVIGLFLAGRSNGQQGTPASTGLTEEPEAGVAPVPQPADAAPAQLPPPIPGTAYAYGGAGTYPGYVAPVAQPVVVTPRPPKHRSFLGLVALSIAVIVGGVLASLAWTGAASIPFVVIFGVMLAILGTGMIVGGFVGRAKWLTFLAIPLLFVTITASFIPSDLGSKLGHGAGNRYWTPTSVAELSTPYQLSVGTARLDLTQLVFPKGTDTATVNATVDFGTLQVFVPVTARVYVNATVGNGQLRVGNSYSSTADGTAPPSYTYSNSGQKVSFTGPMLDNPKTGPIINLNLSSSLGTVEVNRA